MFSEYRLVFKFIYFFVVCKIEYLLNLKYGFNKVMVSLVEEMKMFGFDRGYIFFLFIGFINFRGGIFVFLVDIFVSNKVGGFKEGVGGVRRKCRYCMVNFEEM